MTSSIVDQFRKVQIHAESPELSMRDDRLDSLNLIIGRLSHDFNNYLAPIMGYLALIKEETSQDSAILRYIGTLEQSAQKTESVIETNLLMSQPQRRFRPKKTDLREIVAKEIAEWEKNLPETISIVISKELDKCESGLDGSHWSELVRQLLKNARFALSMGGELSISLKRSRWESEITREYGIVLNHGWELIVKDNGFGMSSEVKRKAFEPFFSTRPKNNAQGLGLTIVHSVVRWHGGQVLLESEEDVGTTVRICFPFIKLDDHSESQLTVPKKRTSFKEPKIGDSKILVVEDDPLILEVIKLCLTNAGFSVVTAANGEQGFRIFKRHQSACVLVVSDLIMPKLTGIEMAKKIRELSSSVSMIFISGDSNASHMVQIKELETEKEKIPLLLKKPFKLNTLIKKVRERIS